MKTNKDIILKYLLLLFFILAFVLTLLININISYQGDDYYYITFTQDTPENFLNEHFSHYMTTNGRFIPHILATLFLGADLIFWKVFNSLMLASIVLFSTKIISYKSNNYCTYILSGIIMTCRNMFVAN